MEYRKFDYKTKEEFLRDAEQLKQGIPWSDDTEVLSSDIEIEGKTVKNRLTAQPIEGFDSEKDGIPGSKSFARYQKLADGGSGMIWMESVSVSYEGKSTARQMWIREENVQEFKKLTDNMHEHGNPYLVCQITHSGRNSNPDGKHLAVCAFENPMIPRENYRTITDDELDQLKEDYVQAAILVEEAGYDAVDIRTCHGYLLNELLGASMWMGDCKGWKHKPGHDRTVTAGKRTGRTGSFDLEYQCRNRGNQSIYDKTIQCRRTNPK